MKRTRLAVWFIFILIFFVGCKNTKQPDLDSKFDEALARYEAKDYQKAYKEISELAELGHPEAQGVLGSMYGLGLGVEKNPQKAAYWYEKSAEGGFAPAMADLASYYYHGNGVAQDCSKSLYWYNKATERRVSRAMYSMHVILNGSLCSEKDVERSNDLLIMASRNNDDTAILSKGVMYYKGIGVAKDYKKAVKLFESLSEKNSDALFYLSRCYLYGHGVAKDKNRAIELLTEASDIGNSTADYNLAVLYYTGKHVDKDYVKAFKYAYKSSNTIPESSYLIGVMYEYGLGFEADIAKSEEWYTKAAMSGDDNAKKSLLRIINSNK